ncbi:cell surface protein SprA [bacterium SCSIO 12741]|nr:cell surface protein SprA [bacterium SCSIO 12741]
MPKIQVMPVDSGDSDDVKLRYPFRDTESTEVSGEEPSLGLGDPGNIKTEVKYNPETGQYEVTKTMGDGIDYRPPTYMDFDEYMEYTRKKTLSDYWKEKKTAEEEFEEGGSGGGSKAFRPELKIKSKVFDRVFGGNTIDIRPSGSAELSFGARISRTDNPVIPVRNRRITTFQFDQNMQINVIGNVGDKLKITTNYNTQSTFDFQNQFKMDYTGYEDEMLQKVELGNVSMPLNSQLITGSQSLFGIKTKFQFGRLTMTTVLSQERGQKSEVETKGGAQISDFEVKADNYEADKHYFLDQYFRDQYEEAVSDPMVLNTTVNVTRVEVWVTNTRTDPNARDIIAFQDLGTGGMDFTKFFNARWVRGTSPPWPDNSHNSLYFTVNDPATGFGDNRTIDQAIPVLQNDLGLDPRLDFQKVELARKLEPSEYTLHPQLGYISLKQRMNSNQVLAVAYEYTVNGEVYQVGEFSVDLAEPAPLLVKMLKSTELNTRVPMWDLMMKNIYSIGAYRVKKDGFKFNVWYLDQNRGVDINFLPEDEINDFSLIQLLGMDSLDFNGRQRSDGVFDFVDKITINTENGRIIIPRLEPFGDGLRRAFESIDGITPQRVEALMDLYSFDSLYTNTQADAKVKWPERNRFTLKGEYQSESSNEIALNAMNIPEGSVTVTAGGRQLVENQDYTVDYTLGRVKIINQSIIESNTPIKVNLESNQLFAQQQKNFLAHRMDYKISDDFIIGGTLMHLWERPLTQKVDIGYEPISNWVWGVDLAYKTELPWLTRVIDKIPGIDTKEKSTLSVSGEFAQILPGHSNAIGKDGNSYIDDFEGSQNTIDLRSFSTWFLAGTPKEQLEEFPEGNLFDNVAKNFNRALFNWRVVDPIFYQNQAPPNIQGDQEQLSNHFVRQVFVEEVFPNRQLAVGQNTNISMLDMTFYPSERGFYNYDIDGLDPNGNRYSAGVNEGGLLNEPATRWGGIMRRIDQNDFEAANIEYIQFWVMDPFNEDYEGGAEKGYLYFNLGNISEDVMNDGLNIYEQLLPNNEAEATDINFGVTSEWGRVTQGTPFATGFDNDPATRPYQDVGLDGFRSEEEAEFYSDFLTKAEGAITDQVALELLKADPSTDDYHYFRGDDYDNDALSIMERYKKYNGTEGNSPTEEQYRSQNSGGYSTAASIRPDKEDINGDNVVNPVEAYYQYKVEISQEALDPSNIGNNFINDILVTSTSTVDGRKRDIKWYQFRIPIRTNKKTKHGNINDFRSIRFIRMFMKGFKDPQTLRFARLELVRGEWRRYLGDIDDNTEGITSDIEADFTVGAVNIEENSGKTPVNYVLPPGIQREINVNTTSLQQINEQSLQMTVCGLEDGKAQATYRNTDLDLRMYGRVKMYVHAESLANQDEISDGDVTVFVRFGTDFVNNYYEYEIPATITPAGYYNPDHEPAQREVWPLENEIDLPLDVLTNLKIARDRLLLDGASDMLSRKRYSEPYENGTVYVVGNPNLGGVRTIMIGIRNPRAPDGSTSDDGMPKCAEVWVNELRLSDFDQTNGWATVGQANLKMADLANVSVTGGMSTPGWGSIDKKVSERQKETKRNINVTTSVNLDKFLPEQWGVKLPMYASYSADLEDPLFTPLAPDIEFKDYVKAFDDKAQRDSVKKVSRDRIIRKSLNFTNVRKERTKTDGKKTPIDISNFTASYAYSEENHTNYETERDLTRNQKGTLTYNYGFSPKPIKPLSKAKFLKGSKYLKLAREMNFYVLPKNISFNTSMNRLYNAYKVRNNNPGITARLPEFYNKQFNWNTDYAVKYDLTKNLSLDFRAANQSLIEEPDGAAERGRNEEITLENGETIGQYDYWKQEVWSNILSGGERMNYNHSLNISYKIPLNMIPATDWINSTLRYGSTYSWQRSPLGREEFGNIIQNSNTISANGTFSFKRLYNKWGYLKKVEQKARRHQQMKDRQKAKERAQKNKNKEITENADGESAPDEPKKSKQKSNYKMGDRMVKFLMMVQNATLTYSLNKGTMLPGFNQSNSFVGTNGNFSNPAPGWGFVFGQQGGFDGTDETEFWTHAARKGWLEQNPNLNNRVSQTETENISFRATAEPIRSLRINFTANRKQSTNNSLFYRYNPDSLSSDGTNWFEQSPTVSGNYSVSFFALRTSLVRDDPVSGSNRVFEQFLANREVISQRQADEPGSNSNGEHLKNDGYADGYGPTSADVLIPSFLAAYSGKDASTSKLNFRDILPSINWRLTYNGLSKIPAFKNLFKTVTISSGYTSSMTVANFVNNQRWQEDSIFYDLDSNFVTEFQYNSVTISEQFSPLINLDLQWKNKITTRFELKTGRTVALNVGSAQIMEQKTRTYVIGLGYQFPFTFPVKINGKNPQSDIKLRGDFSIRQNSTIIRKIVENTHTPTAGQDVLSVKVTADYQLTQALNLRLFYDYVLNTPKISNSFKTANTNFGISIRFSIS